MTDVADTTIAPVRKTVTVDAGIDHAFKVYTEGFDTWWPRSHHIGKSPMKKAIIEPKAGGRCYSEQVDGTECDWGRILEWQPPNRIVMAWMITHEWGYEPDITKASEVEIRFTRVSPTQTRVDLEHRHFERMGSGAASMRTAVDGQMGWGALLRLFADRASTQR